MIDTLTLVAKNILHKLIIGLPHTVYVSEALVGSGLVVIHFNSGPDILVWLATETILGAAI